ncbi:MAG: hypothetical protein HXN79_01225 [Prevotella pallens]|mgnify:CR=1 FL=1|jgi:hypothetical protein|uniref:hypothetical protein n=1 Tax=Prevotella pallens TaxID=60133 RepID=UPI001CB54D22|nr:hypothetical protein [Prevotella pallens]MBF1486934.1 hypothetical protein [Prevotella pallens]
MKARVRATGEIVDVKFSTHPNPAIDETYWWCKDNQTAYHKSELDFMGENIDWEQRRYEIAKEAMNGILSAPVVAGVDPNPSYKDIATFSVRLADALIAELKGDEK